MTQTALITGASGGIGLELARIFAARQYRLVLVARSRDKLETLAAELSQTGIQVMVIAADLARTEEVEKLYNNLQQQSFVVDILVNNAGVGDFGLFHEREWGKQAEMIDLNIKSLTYLTHLLLPGMVARKRGRILNVASLAAFQPGPTMAVYYATKAYVLHFSEAISNELEGTGVTVTALCPGPTESGFQKAADMNESKLFEKNNLPTSAEVAQYGYKALMEGKVVAIHGLLNNLMAASIRFAPRAMVRKVVRAMQEKRK